MAKNTVPSSVRVTVAIPSSVHADLTTLSDLSGVSISSLLVALVGNQRYDLAYAAEWFQAHSATLAKDAALSDRAHHALTMHDWQPIADRLQTITPGWKSSAERDLAGSSRKLAEEAEDILQMVAQWRAKSGAAAHFDLQQK
ncbi:MAG: hypothetical protein CL725_08890 [Chloroflexi bacterium]|nr:hypothetical protein [Chloroflexota bacterium]|tara:strand:- start:2651 stop:3076 length:426 start_codon:yes stop_codon:yes gene_type:complete